MKADLTLVLTPPVAAAPARACGCTAALPACATSTEMMHWWGRRRI